MASPISQVANTRNFELIVWKDSQQNGSAPKHMPTRSIIIRCDAVGRVLPVQQGSARRRFSVVQEQAGRYTVHCKSLSTKLTVAGISSIFCPQSVHKGGTAAFMAAFSRRF